jgi:hypothetical protein
MAQDSCGTVANPRMPRIWTTMEAHNSGPVRPYGQSTRNSLHAHAGYGRLGFFARHAAKAVIASPPPIAAGSSCSGGLRNKTHATSITSAAMSINSAISRSGDPGAILLFDISALLWVRSPTNK